MLEDFEYLTRLAEDLALFAKNSEGAKRDCFLLSLQKVSAAAEAMLLLTTAEEAEAESRALPN